MVALLAEGVDRNNIQNVMAEMNAESPSSRRAWIEILRRLWLLPACGVGLLAEGVDAMMPFTTAYGS